MDLGERMSTMSTVSNRIRSVVAAVAVTVLLSACEVVGSVPPATGSASLSLDAYVMDAPGQVTATMKLVATGFPEGGLYDPTASPSVFPVVPADVYPFVGFALFPIATVNGATAGPDAFGLGDGTWSAARGRSRGGSTGGGHGGRGGGGDRGGRGGAMRGGGSAAFGAATPLVQLSDDALIRALGGDPSDPGFPDELRLLSAAGRCGVFSLYAALLLDSPFPGAAGMYLRSGASSNGWTSFADTPGLGAGPAAPGDSLSVSMPLRVSGVSDTTVFRVIAVSGRVLDLDGDGVFEPLADPNPDYFYCDGVSMSTLTYIGRSGVPSSLDGWQASFGGLSGSMAALPAELRKQLQPNDIRSIIAGLQP